MIRDLVRRTIRWPEWLYGVARKARLMHYGYPGEKLPGDSVQKGAMALALQDLDETGIMGDIAEFGVGCGWTSAFLRQVSPKRKMHLFDTFCGWPGLDPASINTVERVGKRIGDISNVEFHKGELAETIARARPDVTYAFVHIDLNMPKLTLTALRHVWPHLVSGGYLFLHDYNRGPLSEGIRGAARHVIPEGGFITLPDSALSGVKRRTYA